ncbi:MAG: metal-dependent transcriptional regulator [Thermodesulfobacteriota bacterium]
MKYDEESDELLELIWKLREEGIQDEETIYIRSWNKDVKKAIRCALEADLISDIDGKISLTIMGDARAKMIVRRHRLAEKLLKDILQVGSSEMDSTACELEHILGSEVTESICAFLGHPRFCPHEKPIPPGECCGIFKEETKEFVVPLAKVIPGDRVKIIFLVPRHHRRLHQLTNLGIIPGAEIVLHQKQPAYVLRAGETDIAIDDEIARHIYVRKVST